MQQLKSKAVLGGYLLATITGPRSTDKLIRAPACCTSIPLSRTSGRSERESEGGGRCPSTYDTVRTCTILIVGHFRQEIHLLF